MTWISLSVGYMRLWWSDPIPAHEPCDSADTHVNAFCQLVRPLIFWYCLSRISIILVQIRS